MKMFNKLALVSLSSLLAVACMAGAPPKTAGGGVAAGAPAGPAPAPLVGHNLVYNGDFGKGGRSLPWNGELSKPAAGRTFVDKGELCLEVTNRGLNRWDAQLRHQHIKLEKGHRYTIQFKVRSTQKTRVYLKLGQAGPPFREFWKLLFPVEEKPQTYSGTFTMDGPDDPGIEMAFHMGGQLARLTPAPFTVCLDDIRVDDPQYTEVPEPVPPPIPNVLVNQVGYFPGLAKIATTKNPNAVPSRTSATRRCRARRAAAARTSWTSAAAGTTRETRASTSSTPGSRSGRCSTGGSAASRSAGRRTLPTGR